MQFCQWICMFHPTYARLPVHLFLNWLPTCMPLCLTWDMTSRSPSMRIQPYGSTELYSSNQQLSWGNSKHTKLAAVDNTERHQSMKSLRWKIIQWIVMGCRNRKAYHQIIWLDAISLDEVAWLYFFISNTVEISKYELRWDAMRWLNWEDTIDQTSCHIEGCHWAMLTEVVIPYTCLCHMDV